MQPTCCSCYHNRFSQYIRQKGSGKEERKLEAEDVLPNTNHTQAAGRTKKYRFLSLVTSTFDL